MRVVVGRKAGFCKGVRDALDVTLEAIKTLQEGESICTFGPLIHNRQVLAMLEEKGIREETEIANCAHKKVVIRAHGIPPQERQALHQHGATLLDATCKRVARVQAAIKRHARRGYHTIIVGDADHAEVIGLMGYTEGRGRVINRAEQVAELPAAWNDKVLLVAQTTQNEEIFQEIQAKFLERFPQGTVNNTICGSTHERQAEVRELCSQVEAMVIVGGHHSGNTMRLAQVARESGVPAYHVETEAELDAREMARYASVGVSAGASTPNWMIRNVVCFLESIESEHSAGLLRWKKGLGLLAYANICAALAAALLIAATHALTGLAGSMAHAGMAAAYVFAMHTLNLYLDHDAIRFNDPGRAAFYQRWRFSFTGCGIASVVIALWLASGIGTLTFLAMSVLILLGIFYAVPLILPSRWQSLSALKIKDIPASKTFLVPLAWASAIVVLPNLSYFSSMSSRMAYAFLVFFLLVLIRTALLDMLAVQGDRLVGKETIVVFIGERRSMYFISGVLVLLAIILPAGPLLGLSSAFSLAVLPAVAIYAYFLRMCLQNRMNEDPIFEAMVESTLIATGVLGFLWTVL